MTRVVYKYPIEDVAVTVEAVDQKVIHVGIDPKINEVCVWIEHSTDTTGEGWRRVEYRIFGTGFEMDDDGSVHVGSCITRDGYVWHVFGRVLP